MPRNFVGSKWQIVRSAEGMANQINTYRVLLTRARYETGDFLCPRGDAADITRGARRCMTVSRGGAHLLACGAGVLADEVGRGAP